MENEQNSTYVCVCMFKLCLIILINSHVVRTTTPFGHLASTSKLIVSGLVVFCPWTFIIKQSYIKIYNLSVDKIKAPPPTSTTTTSWSSTITSTTMTEDPHFNWYSVPSYFCMIPHYLYDSRYWPNSVISITLQTFFPVHHRYFKVVIR